jgi:hypothetical protein
MNLRKTLSVLGLLLAVTTIMLPVVRANDWNQTTWFTFSQPVQIPGQVLPAGMYRFQLADTDNRHLVRIFREDRTLEATLYSVPRVRDGRGAEVAITLANRGGAEPEVIVAWFFVGEADGHEFLYPKREKQELAHSTRVTVVTGD